MGAPRSPCALGTSLLCCLLAAVLAQRVKVQHEVTGYVGQEVTLPCNFINTSREIKVSQVTWVKETSGRKQNVAVYHPDHGPSYPMEKGSGRIRFWAQSLQDATLVIGPLRMSDEGTYTCEFATYPLGNEDGITRLTILAKPTNFAEAVEVKAGNAEVPVASCTSSNGKPAAQITWQSGLNGNFTTSEVTNTNGTVTVTSHYMMVPTKAANDQRIFCHVEQKTLAQPESLPVTLSILYPPEVSILGYDDNWYLSREEAVLTCSAMGNPPPTNITWTTSSGSLPKTVAIKGDRLVVRNVDASVNTTFICHAINRVGRVSSEQNIFVRDRPAERQTGSAGAVAGAAVGGILAVALLGALVVVFVLRRRRLRSTKGSYDPKTRVFGNGTAPPPVRSFAELDRPLKAAPGRGQVEEEEEEEEEEELRKDRRLPYGYPSRRLDDEEEQFDQLGPMLRLGSSPHGYEYDDMESQHDGSIISKTAVYV
ncbi:nectin-2 isoform X2 [Paroedura picta]|uniref:nectin-2 isoform X2 n=1 Tax=Paroedura picta TaxID=143630 RepID=UPI004057C8ED